MSATRYTWSRMAAHPVEHIAGAYPQHQPICGASLSVRTQTFADAPSGYAPLCARCQAKARSIEKKSRV